MFNFGRTILNYCSSLRQHALPASCLLCAAPATRANLCEGCYADLPRLPPAHCPVCAEPTLDSAICGVCLAHPRKFDRVLAPAAYAYPLDRLIQSFKYGGNLAVAPLLADLMLARIEAEPLPDLIVPMPLSTERLKERGFNQSLQIAELIAKRTGVPVDPDVCQRVRHGDAQSSLPYRRRADNVRGAFVCMRDIEGCSIAIVDDVLTTGSTLDELARVLRLCGASRITGWTAARTLPNSA